MAGYFGSAFGVAAFSGSMVALSVTLAWRNSVAVQIAGDERQARVVIAGRLAFFDTLTCLQIWSRSAARRG